MTVRAAFAMVAVILLPHPVRAQLLTPEARASLGDKALGVLRSAMNDEDANIRVLAAHEWGGIGNRAAIPVLRLLLRDSDPHVRIAAAWSLYQLGDRSGIAVLLRIVKTGMKKVAVEKGGKKGKKKKVAAPNPLEELRSIARDKARVEAVNCLSQINSSGTVKLMEILEKDASGAVRDAAAIALTRLGQEDHMRQFVDALGSDDEAERLTAVRSLADVATSAVIPYLHRVMDDASISVRAAALQGLGATGSPDALADIQQGMKDPNELVRSAAVEALSRIPSPEAIAPLKAAMAEGATVYVRLLAIRGLARQGQEVDLGLVERSLDQTDTDARALAVDVLEASNGGEWALKLLETALNDSQPRIRVRAATALIKILQNKTEAK